MSAPTRGSVWLNITTGDGELLERIDLSEFDLSKPFARTALMAEIRQAVARAQHPEVEQDDAGASR